MSNLSCLKGVILVRQAARDDIRALIHHFVYHMVPSIMTDSGESLRFIYAAVIISHFSEYRRFWTLGHTFLD